MFEHSVKPAIGINLCSLLIRGDILKHDNAHPYEAELTSAKLQEWVGRSDPAYSSDSAPCDFYLSE